MHGIIAKRSGHQVTILEQYESATREGQAAGIAAMEYGTKFLNKHDLLLQDHPYAVSCPGVQILSSKAEVKMKLDRPLTMTSWNVLYYRLRANFDGLKSATSPWVPKPLRGDGKADYLHGKRVTSVTTVDDKVQVDFADSSGGGTLRPDVVIAADGSTSPIRSQLLPNLQRTYAGYAIWRGTVPESEVSESTRQLFGTRTNLITINAGYIALLVLFRSITVFLI